MTGLRPKKELFPLSLLYGAIIALRNALYDWRLLPQYRSSLPVICVGNVTAGGSGKTPFVQYLAEKLKRAGYQPVILSRGYKGKLPGPHHVKLGDSAADVGDEALSHRDKLRGIAEVVIAKRRSDGAKLVEQLQLGTVILLDDGFQHRALRRNFNILLLDVTSEETTQKWSRGMLLPAGWMRETLRSAKKRADAAVLVSKGRAKSSPPSLGDVPTFAFQFVPRSIRDVQANVKLPTEVLRGKPIIAATGIGEPQHFFALLRELGATIELEREYDDHHPFTREDLESLAPSAARPLFVTSKDAIKLKNFLRTPGQVYSLELGGGFLNLTQEQEFLKLCIAAVTSKQ